MNPRFVLLSLLVIILPLQNAQAMHQPRSVVGFDDVTLLAAIVVVVPYLLENYGKHKKVKLITSEGETIEVPEVIVRQIVSIHNMVIDLGGYKSLDPNNPIPVCATKSQIEKIIKIFNKDQSTESLFESASEDELIDFIKVVNFLDIPNVLQAAAKLFATKCLFTTNSFRDLLDEIKEAIIEQLMPLELMKLIFTNHAQLMSNPQHEEEIFRVALKVHYKKQPNNESTAKEIYRELFFGRYVSIPGGTYSIGSPETENDHQKNEQLHEVALEPFEICEVVVTQLIYVTVTGNNPSRFQGNLECPVEYLSWGEAAKFAQILSDLDPLYNYILPTEEQTEVAKRGGTTTAFVSGDDENGLEEYYIYLKNSGSKTHPVKTKPDGGPLRANPFGIYHCGVLEWTVTPSDSSLVVVRGGSWCTWAQCCRSAFRSNRRPGVRAAFLGFRLVRTPKSHALTGFRSLNPSNACSIFALVGHLLGSNP